MGTTLTGTTPQDTYDSLIKVTDNGPLSGSLKTLTDGLGNDSALALSTGGASITGTLAVSGNATFDTTTLVVDATNDRVGIGKSSPTAKLDVALPSDGTAGAIFGYTGGSNNPRMFFNVNESTSKGQIILSGSSGALDFGLGAGGAEIITLKGSGSVGIGTSAPTQKLTVNGNAAVGGQQAFWLRDDDGFSGNAARRAWAITANYATIGTFSIYGASAANSDPLAGTPFLNITSAGVLDLNQGQIKFPATQVASADPNTLDDYEEGTFTPTLNFDGNSVGITYIEQAGKYTKIGNKVSFAIVISLSSKGSSTGNARIAGLPFNISPSSGADFIPFTIGAFVSITFADVPAAVGITNNNYFVLDEMVSGAPQTALTNADFSNSSFIRVSGFYFV